MRKTIITAALLAVGFSGLAVAGEHDRRAFAAIDGPTVQAADVVRTLERLGYRVDKLKMEHGRFELRAVNDSGLPIKAYYNATTGELVRARLR